MLNEEMEEYWDRVRKCLVRFFEFTPYDAERRSVELRTRLDESAARHRIKYPDTDPTPLYYHQEELETAAGIAGHRPGRAGYNEMIAAIADDYIKMTETD